MRTTICIFVSLLMIQCGRKAEISQWRGPDRDGVYHETNLLTAWPENGPEKLWSYDSLGLGYTSAAVTSEKIFTTGTHDSISYIFAFDHDGRLLWKKPFGREWMVNFPGARSTPLICGNRGYLLSGLGKLVCFDTDDGELVWSKDFYTDFDGREIRFGLTENLLMDGDKLFCTPGGEEFNVVALNRHTGDLIWKSPGAGEPSAYCSPTIYEHNGRRFFTTITERSIFALDPESGGVIWSRDLEYPDGIHGNTPLYRDGYLFAMNGWGWGSRMLKLNDAGTAAEEVWRSNLFDLEHGDVVLIGDNIYGTDYTTRHFSCVDWKTGAVKDSVKEFAPATVVQAEGLIYCYAYDGDMVLMRPEPDGFSVISKFKPLGKKRDHLAHPVIHDGKLYLRYANSMAVYDISAKS